jgi:LysM repeat protein
MTGGAQHCLKTRSAFKNVFLCVCAVSAAVSLCGCATSGQQLAENARLRADLVLLREDLVRAEGRLEGLDLESRRIAKELEETRKTTGQDREAAAETARKIKDIENRIEQAESSRVADKEEIIRQISAKMAELIAKSAASRGKAHAVSGYEHIVKSGETLSQIAEAYNVSSQAIIDENGLQNPNLLREGQKLFIPQ